MKGNKQYIYMALPMMNDEYQYNIISLAVLTVVLV